ncbi:unnamed protein product [Bursaphelenchus okinawaensis]|uniref:glucuronosyltransferase n=1 Tax=Bursaphelenchus okinawaensis TaxID=465554 RepID=A0A811LLE7_9BILA|nr:unnamed protein product [Bursaphelenchus okinawaensis]CAG9123857.1 unnamed protein product [Bursaphelenchus okinawaensis]
MGHINYVYLLVIAFAVLTDGAEILATYADGVFSHMYSMYPYLESLANEGHKVTIFHTGIAKPPVFDHPNISQLEIRRQNETSVVELLGTVFWKMSSHSDEPPMITANNDKVLKKEIDEHSEELMKIFNRRWDLIIIDTLFDNQGYAAAMYHHEKYGTPYINYMTSHILEVDAVWNSMGRAWSQKMSLFVPIPKDSDDVFDVTKFTHRLTTFYENSVEFLLFSLAPYFTFSAIKELGIDGFSLQKLRTHSPLYITDGFRGFEAAPEAIDFQSIGAYCASGDAVSGELKTFIEDKTSKGTIYVSFGSLVRWNLAPQQVVDAVFSALNTLSEYRIVVSSKTEINHKLGSHIKVVKWAPQVGLLNHKSTKLFISHGGIKSVKEAICSATPTVFVPIFAEQAHNSRQMAKKKVATVINKFTISQKNVLKEVNKILQDPSYQARMDNFRDHYKAGPITNLEMAVHLTNRLENDLDLIATFNTLKLYLAGKLHQVELTLYLYSKGEFKHYVIQQVTAKAKIAFRFDCNTFDKCFVTASTTDLLEHLQPTFDQYDGFFFLAMRADLREILLRHLDKTQSHPYMPMDEPNWAYYFDDKQIENLMKMDLTPPTGYEYSVLTEKDAKRVSEDQLYTSKGDDRIMAIKLAGLPSSSLIHTATSDLASYIGNDGFGMLAWLYTMKEHRHKRLATLVEMKLHQSDVLELGMRPFKAVSLNRPRVLEMSKPYYTTIKGPDGKEIIFYFTYRCKQPKPKVHIYEN